MNFNSNLTNDSSPEGAAISNLEEFCQYICDNSVGDRALSIRGLARLCEVHDTAIIRGADFYSQKLAQKLTGIGFEAADLVKYGFNASSAWAVVEYFAYESQAKAEGAKRLARLFGALGVSKAFELAHETPVKAPNSVVFRRSSLWAVRLTEARNVMIYRFLTKKLPKDSQAFLLEEVEPKTLERLMELPEMILDYLVAAIEVKELHQERLYQVAALTSAGLQRVQAPSFDFEGLNRRVADAEEYLARFSIEKAGYDEAISRSDWE
jgi:hypothetical protein